MADRKSTKLYATAIILWAARFDTAEIAEHTGLPEYLVARWVATYREATRGTRCA